jgi:hypothetical protein
MELCDYPMMRRMFARHPEPAEFKHRCLPPGESHRRAVSHSPRSLLAQPDFAVFNNKCLYWMCVRTMYGS